MKRRVVFTNAGVFERLAPDMMDEEVIHIDTFLIKSYTLRELDAACDALGLNFEDIVGCGPWEAEFMTDEEQNEIEDKIIAAIKEAV
jgi:hypothetical protein